MKKTLSVIACTLALTISGSVANAQKKGDAGSAITASDLQAYVSFLASAPMKGRANGDESLDIAANYIASQVKILGLKPANGNSYFQPYSIIRKEFNPAKTFISVRTGNDSVTIKEPVYQIVPTGPSDISLSGEVVFAGYGIKSDKYKYNDLENLKAEGKIILIMDRAPMSEDGKKCKFEEPVWTSSMNFQYKLTTLVLTKAKAILIVPDPKSGFSSFGDMHPGIAGYLSSAMSLKGEKQVMNPMMANLPKIAFVHRSVADALLSGTGKNLEELQKEIDSGMKPSTFTVEGKKLRLSEAVAESEHVQNNVAAIVEGRDPQLKNEYVIFSGHYDHVGITNGKINFGADDNASGTASLLSIAEAFQSLPKKPLRSVLFLWVSGEEIGLYGSKTYTDNPLVPLEKTVADLNMDMIGRVKTPADSTSENPMTGPNGVFVITGNQSKELIEIANNVDKTSPVELDYSLSGRNHPLQLFSRSDHYNFVKKDIPVLFFTTGIHTDYHTPGDVVEKLDFAKMELVSRTMFRIGFEVANRKERIVVDNPFSSWNKK